jgi:lysozyme family protein
MTAANYEACISKVLSYEGGFQNDPNDSGNWTGCAAGAGANRGTNRGISACSYPNEDIKGMTEARAKEIYRQDYWSPIRGDELPAGVDLCTFDGSVNSGQSRGVGWLQRAVGVEADGVVGPQTLSAVYEADDHVTIDRMCDDRLNFRLGRTTARDGRAGSRTCARPPTAWWMLCRGRRSSRRSRCRLNSGCAPTCRSSSR